MLIIIHLPRHMHLAAASGWRKSISTKYSAVTFRHSNENDRNCVTFASNLCRRNKEARWWKLSWGWVKLLFHDNLQSASRVYENERSIHQMYHIASRHTRLHEMNLLVSHVEFFILNVCAIQHEQDRWMGNDEADEGNGSATRGKQKSERSVEMEWLFISEISRVF